jgi:DNA-binding response OmpR family regulator
VSRMKRARVLVVDDDLDIREAIQQGLQIPGFEVEVATAHNALSGLQLVKDLRPDVVIVDLQMPMGSGFELADAVRNDRELENVKLLMLTALDVRQVLWESVDKDIDDFLAKPFDFGELEARIRALLLKDKGTARRI